MTNVVVVESPAKAKTIHKYLGKDFTVVASFGHVRDLPSKQGSVKPDQDFAMEWEVDEGSQKHIKNIVTALKGAKNLYLATDPDREGEAISWHIKQILLDQKKLKDIDVKRIAFNEITKNAVQQALSQPRDLNQELVDAYLARRALDYLVGFTLSPILWRRLPGSKSAGRVQSVALRLVCEREEEIEKFKTQEYWSIEGLFETAAKQIFAARLTHLQGKKLEKFDLKTKDQVDEAVKILQQGSYQVASVEKKQVKRNPMPPFTTSTLQQEASRKLYFGATKTMRTAQRLYEGVAIGSETVGLITYMRTDSVQLSQEAVQSCRQTIEKLYGKKYLPASPRIYKTKAKNAQEAHEAIRPTDLSRTPEQVKPYLEEDLYKLYDLIWRRTMACEMESAVFDQVTVDIDDATKKNQFRAVGSTLVFDGFLKVYQDTEEQKKGEAEKEQEGDDDQNRILPPLAVQDKLKVQEITPSQHFTQPPPRYSEASLVKKLEELGIGRPSTYAATLQVLQDRQYVRLEKRRFFPEERGRVVTAFLKNYFEKYVEYDFTAQLEEQLDDIADGQMAWKKVLAEFWGPFHQAAEGTLSISVREVLDRLDETLSDHLFPETEDGKDPRACPTCADGRLGMKLGKFGVFIGCSNYPDCRYTRKIEEAGDGSESGEGASSKFEPRILGFHPQTQAEISVRKGPYGFYVQATQLDQEGAPKRSSVPPGYDPSYMDLEQALGLLALPRELGNHPETGQLISAGIGRFGPYLKHGSAFQSLGQDEDVLSIGLNRAVTLLAESKDKSGRHLGDHPQDKQPIHVLRGRYGPYLKHGKANIPIPKSEDPDSLGLDRAVEIIGNYQPKPKTKTGPKRTKK